MARAERVLTARFVLVVASGLAYFLALGMLLPVVPRYVEGPLGGGSLEVGIAVGVLFVGAVLLRPYAGRLGDRFGRRWLIIGGAATVAVSIGLYGVVQSLGFLIAARILTGLGEAAFFVGAATMITDLAPPHRRGEAISYWSIAVYGGMAIGPVLGELALDESGYDTVWLSAAALGVVATLLAVGTREVPRDTAAPPGGPLIARAAVWPGLVLFSGLLALAAFNSFVPLYVGQIGLDGADAAFLLYGGLVLCVRIFGARLPDQLGAQRSGSLALSGSMLGMAVMAAWASPAGLYSGTALFAGGMSLLYPALLLLALGGAPDSERGSVVGTFSSFFDLSQGLGALIVGGVAAATDYRGAFAAGAVAALAGLLMLRTRGERMVREARESDVGALVAEHPAQ
jgi:MFS family permease